MILLLSLLSNMHDCASSRGISRPVTPVHTSTQEKEEEEDEEEVILRRQSFQIQELSAPLCATEFLPRNCFRPASENF